MKRILCTVAILMTLSAVLPAEELPPPAAEIVKNLEQESDLIRTQIETEIAAKRETPILKLQEILSNYTKDAKLDEAVAIRDLIRGIKNAGLRPLTNPTLITKYIEQNGRQVAISEVNQLPPQAVEIIKSMEQESDPLRTRLETEIAAKREVANQKLKVIQDKLTREARLDEAVLIRNTIRQPQPAAQDPQPGARTVIRGQGTALLATVSDVLPPDAAELIKALEQESDQIRAQFETDIAAKRTTAIQKLQEIQDSLTRESKLDEALAVRDFIRNLKNPEQSRLRTPPAPVVPQFNRGPMNGLPGNGFPVNRLNGFPVNRGPVANAPVQVVQTLPPQAAEVVTLLEQQTDQIRAKMETEIASKRSAAIRKLQELQDKYARDAKLDEAVAIRTTIRNLKSSGLKPQPDPGSLVQYRGQIGKVLLFEVVGGFNGSIYGTDIYTDDSSLSTASVHAGILKPGEKGIVKVTILAGQDSYAGTSRNGVASSPWNQYPGSFKVQSLFGGNRPPATAIPVPAPAPAVNRPKLIEPFLEINEAEAPVVRPLER